MTMITVERLRAARVVNLKFYDEDLHKKLKFQALKEETSLQSLIIKACQEYLDRVKKSE